MKIKRSGVFFIPILFFFCTAFVDPAAAKVMSVKDFKGDYYGARIMDTDGAFRTGLYDITADGNGGVSFTTIEGTLGPLTSTYDIDDRGLLTAQDGIIRGAISPDGEYLAIGKFSQSEPPSLLFAIAQSSGLTNEIIAGNYSIYLLYVISGAEDGAILNSSAGNFHATDDVLSGNFTGDDPELRFNGVYAVDYSVAPDGRLTLTFTDGQNAAELGPMHGVVSKNGNAFVVVDTTNEGARAYAVGIQQSESTEGNMAGDYYVTDFGYYDFYDDNTGNDAAGFIMDFNAAADGTLSFLETASTCDDCLIDKKITGTYELSGGYQFFTDFDNSLGGTKADSTLNLTPGGSVFSLTHPTYLGIGIEQASGTPEDGDSDGDDHDSDGSCFIRSIWD